MRALHFHNGDPHELIALLERGLQDSLPGEVKARLLDQPSLCVTEGLVLEFSHPADLQRLRRQPNLRQRVEQFLSPRHILVSTKDAPRLLKMFERRGLHTSFNEEPPQAIKKRTHYPRNELLQPVGKSVPKMEMLETYMRLQQALDILYRSPGHSAEQRRITPLSIEERRGHTYVIAHCHTRRAQRQFRLDRMEIPGTF